MIKNGIGGANTNKSGLAFEATTDIATFLSKQKDYIVGKNKYYGNGQRASTYGVSYKNKDNIVAYIFKQATIGNFLKDEHHIDYKNFISMRLMPDDSIYVLSKGTLFIIEVKKQTVSGSVDEKIQTCDFKKKQGQKIVSQINGRVEYVYILSDYFKQERYKDVLDYIISVNCHYFFNHIPLEGFGLPIPK